MKRTSREIQLKFYKFMALPALLDNERIVGSCGERKSRLATEIKCLYLAWSLRTGKYKAAVDLKPRPIERPKPL